MTSDRQSPLTDGTERNAFFAAAGSNHKLNSCHDGPASPHALAYAADY